MEAIYIPHLKKLAEKTEVITIQEFIPELETLTPVRGNLKVTHQGNYLEVSAKAETIITLMCHRCLQQYNHRLSIDTKEIIWLDKSVEQEDISLVEKETALDDLIETLSPEGNFEPDVWIYEQLCLAIPLKQICGAECLGIPLKNSDNITSNPLSDSRWASLEALKKQLGNGE